MIFCFCSSVGICQNHKRLIIAPAWMQKHGPSLQTHSSSDTLWPLQQPLPSAEKFTHSSTLSFIPPILLALGLDICSFLLKHQSFFTLTSSTKREDHQNPSLQHWPISGVLVPSLLTVLRRCLLSPSYTLLYGSVLTFQPHSTLEHAVFRSMKHPGQN